MDTPFVEPASPLTRQEDKEARILDMAQIGADRDSDEDPGLAEPSSAAGESTNPTPTLGLSKAFDSFDATMRLAALTGMEKELDKFSETQKIARLKALADAKRGVASAKASTLSGSATWQQSAAGGRNAAPTSMSATQLKLIWLGSGVLAAAAAVVFLLR